MKKTLINTTETISTSNFVISQVKNQIKELQKLEAGWDFGAGEIISQEVGTASADVAEIGLSLGLKADVRPSSEGSIIVSLFEDDHFLFIAVKADGNFDITYEKGIGVNYEILDNKENLSFTAVKKYIVQWVS